MTEDENYLDMADLLERGWTRSLVSRFLGTPDRLFPVHHWRNYSGKRAWLISTVELVEMTQGFEASFLKGSKIRKLSRERTEEVIARIYELREGANRSKITIEEDSQARLNACAGSSTEFLLEARSRGYRTPHKC